MLYRRILPGSDQGSVATKQVYTRTILPAALLLGLSIIFGNKAFLYLNVPSIQMIKVSWWPALPRPMKRFMTNGCPDVQPCRGSLCLMAVQAEQAWY